MSPVQSISQVFRRPAQSSQTLESAALLVGGAVFVIISLVALPFFHGVHVPISGSGSIGQFIAIAGGITAILVYIFARIVLRTRPSRSDGPATDVDAAGVQLHWFDVGALALSHGIIALLGWICVASLLSVSFKGAVVFSFSSIILAGAAVALTAYVCFLSAVHLSATLLSLMLAVFLVVGSFTSMLSATDPLWWQKNLSTLGMSKSVSSLAFNVTLIIAGVAAFALLRSRISPRPGRPGRPRPQPGRN